VKEKLFARRKNEVLSAVNALQNPVLEFHPSCPFIAVLPDTVATTECNAAPDALIAVPRVTCSTPQHRPNEIRAAYFLPLRYECGLLIENPCLKRPSPRRFVPQK
jgi:hypothetical protein